MKELQARGVRVPMLEAQPALSPRAQLALLAWRDLCGERAYGMSVGPIPWRAIVAWCDRYRCSETEVIVELVQVLDAEFLRSEPIAADQYQNDSAGAHRQGRH